MTDNQTVEKTVSLTPELAKSKIQIALTKAEQSIQKLHDAEAALVYNEDNLDSIAKFIADAKKAKGLVEAERVLLKKPYKEGGEAVDAGAKLLSVDLDLVIAKADAPYQKICREVDARKKAAKAAEDRELKIRGDMDTFKLEYSVKISNAKTSAELVAIERLINLETGKENKYFEFLPDFKVSCEPIRSQLAAQKEKVRLLEDLEKQQQEAAKNSDDGAFLEIEEKKEQISSQIEETKINIQETASNQAQQATTPIRQIFAAIPSGGRKLWKWRVVNDVDKEGKEIEGSGLKRAEKKEFAMLVPNEKKIKDFLAENRDSWNDKEIESFIENGIEFYIDKKF